MLKKLVGGLFLIVFSFMNNSCQKEVEQAVVYEEAPAVCIRDEASVRIEASQKASRVSTMALGEKVTWLGRSEIDSSDKTITYLNIRLSDGTEGWTWDKLLVVNAKPAVAIENAIVYRRPDLVTETDKTFEPMELVALKKTLGDWIEVVGEKKIKKGWIHAKLVSSKDSDVAVALLALQAYAVKDDEKMKKKIEVILNNAAFSRSVFINDLNNKIMSLEKSEIIPEEPIHPASDTE